MKVVCIKWGKKYSGLYVTRLKSMVARNLANPHKFVCYTDDPVVGIDCLPLSCDLPTWWSKLGLFKEPATEPTLYLDLDVVISAPIVLPELADKLWTLDDFGYSLKNPRKLNDPHIQRLLGGSGTINSSVMYWQGDFTEVWSKFTPKVMDELHGDQNWITRCLWPDRVSLFPPGLGCSYKYHVQNGIAPSPVTVFHGNPKPSDVTTRWVRENWR